MNIKGLDQGLPVLKTLPTEEKQARGKSIFSSEPSSVEPHSSPLSAEQMKDRGTKIFSTEHSTASEQMKFRGKSIFSTESNPLEEHKLEVKADSSNLENVHAPILTKEDKLSLLSEVYSAEAPAKVEGPSGTVCPLKGKDCKSNPFSKWIPVKTFEPQVAVVDSNKDLIEQSIGLLRSESVPDELVSISTTTARKLPGAPLPHVEMASANKNPFKKWIQKGFTKIREISKPITSTNIEHQSSGQSLSQAKISLAPENPLPPKEELPCLPIIDAMSDPITTRDIPVKEEVPCFPGDNIDIKSHQEEGYLWKTVKAFGGLFSERLPDKKTEQLLEEAFSESDVVKGPSSECDFAPNVSAVPYVINFKSPASSSLVTDEWNREDFAKVNEPITEDPLAAFKAEKIQELKDTVASTGQTIWTKIKEGVEQTQKAQTQKAKILDEAFGKMQTDALDYTETTPDGVLNLFESEAVCEDYLEKLKQYIKSEEFQNLRNAAKSTAKDVWVKGVDAIVQTQVAKKLVKAFEKIERLFERGETEKGITALANLEKETCFAIDPSASSIKTTALIPWVSKLSYFKKADEQCEAVIPKIDEEVKKLKEESTAQSTQEEGYFSIVIKKGKGIASSVSDWIRNLSFMNTKKEEASSDVRPPIEEALCDLEAPVEVFNITKPATSNGWVNNLSFMEKEAKFPHISVSAEEDLFDMKPSVEAFNITKPATSNGWVNKLSFMEKEAKSPHVSVSAEEDLFDMKSSVETFNITKPATSNFWVDNLSFMEKEVKSTHVLVSTEQDLFDMKPSVEAFNITKPATSNGWVNKLSFMEEKIKASNESLPDIEAINITKPASNGDWVNNLSIMKKEPSSFTLAQDNSTIISSEIPLNAKQQGVVDNILEKAQNGTTTVLDGFKKVYNYIPDTSTELKMGLLVAGVGLLAYTLWNRGTTKIESSKEIKQIVPPQSKMAKQIRRKRKVNRTAKKVLSEAEASVIRKKKFLQKLTNTLRKNPHLRHQLMEAIL